MHVNRGLFLGMIVTFRYNVGKSGLIKYLINTLTVESNIYEEFHNFIIFNFNLEYSFFVFLKFLNFPIFQTIDFISFRILEFLIFKILTLGVWGDKFSISRDPESFTEMEFSNFRFFNFRSSWKEKFVNFEI